jgi:hypothetical protein
MFVQHPAFPDVAAWEFSRRHGSHCRRIVSEMLEWKSTGGMLIRKDRVPVLWTLIYVPGFVSGLTLNLAHCRNSFFLSLLSA